MQFGGHLSMESWEGKMIHQSPKPFTQDLPDEAPNSLAVAPQRWPACWPRPRVRWVCWLPFPQATDSEKRCPGRMGFVPLPCWDTPTQSEPLEADASWWTKSASGSSCNLWHVVDMRSGEKLFDLSTCFGNTLHCITSEKGVKDFAAKVMPHFRASPVTCCRTWLLLHVASEYWSLPELFMNLYTIHIHTITRSWCRRAETVNQSWQLC